MQEQWERAIERSLRECGIEVGEGAVGRLARYLELVAQWDPKMRLVGSAEVETLARRHVAESLYLSRVVKLEGQERGGLVGSGAGFPGMALQLAYSGTECHRWWR